MRLTAIKTNPILPGTNLTDVLDQSISNLEENTIVALTSKIISICEERIIAVDKTDKLALIEQEADQHLPHPLSGRYGVTITIKNNILISNAGIDESNGNRHYILWPQNPFDSAERIWKYLKAKFRVSKLGVLITDSHIIPLRWGTRGVAISWCGFSPLKNYIGLPDIFGRKLKVTKSSLVDGLAAAAVVVMGEGDEQTPIVIIADVPFITFVDHPPNRREIDSLKITPEEDLYAPLLTAVSWQKKK